MFSAFNLCKWSKAVLETVIKSQNTIIHLILMYIMTSTKQPLDWHMVSKSISSSRNKALSKNYLIISQHRFAQPRPTGLPRSIIWVGRWLPVLNCTFLPQFHRPLRTYFQDMFKHCGRRRQGCLPRNANWLRHYNATSITRHIHSVCSTKQANAPRYKLCIFSNCCLQFFRPPI